MNTLLTHTKSLFGDKSYPLLVLFFLSLLGSHFLDYYLYILIAFGLFLINWHLVTTKHFLLVLAFTLSVYVSWFFLDPRILYEVHLAQQVLLPGILILLMYMLGLGIQIKKVGYQVVSDKRMFYILFSFVIAYSLLIAWSYFFIPQDSPVTSAGMYVCFPNPYASAHVNGGHLISTILAYYLTLMTFTLPLIVFYFNRLKKQSFYTVELFLLIALSLFVLYISALMGRRTVFVLFTLVFIFIFFTYFFKNIKKVVLIVLILTSMFYAITIYINKTADTPLSKGVIVTNEFIIPIVENPKPLLANLQNNLMMKRLAQRGLKDTRFSWWKKSFSIMLSHPFGGGYDEYVAPGMKLTHNVWLDMGKDLGILPFIFFFIVTLVHIYYLIRIFFSTYIEDFLKYQLIVIGMGLFAIMLIEPVFNSDKTFFAYIFFYFGVVCKVYLESKKVLHQGDS